MDAATYPGEGAKPDDILRLAAEYRAAAHWLLGQRRKGDAFSLAPCRLVAIHAIELYLNAFLLFSGVEQKSVRGLHHDLAQRMTLAAASGLVLRKRTAAHLLSMTGNREYLVTRYGPEMTTSLSQINRLMATLDELAKKAHAYVVSPTVEGPE